MNIYKFLPDEDIVDVKVVKDDDYDPIKPILYLWEKASVAESWKPVPVYFHEHSPKGKKLVRTDFLGNSCSHFIVETRVKETILPLVKAYGEFLPLSNNNGTLWILNVTNIVDAIDFDESELMFPSEPIDYSRPNFANMVFNRQKIGSNFLFRVPQKNIYPTYFTQEFIEAIKKNNLTGFSYIKVANAV